MKKEQTKNNFIKDIIIIVIAGIIINAFCFFAGTIRSRAATSIYNLPYNLANFQAINQPFSQYNDDILNAISESSSVDNGAYFQDSHYFIYLDGVSSSYVYFWVCSNVSFFDTTNIASFSNTYVTFSCNSEKSTIRVIADNNNGVLTNFRVNGYKNSGGTEDILGSQSLRNGYGFDDYRYCYPFVIVGDFYDINNNLVLTNTSVNNGNPTQFENAPLTGHSINNNQPTTPTITAPQIDSSLSVIENIKILFNWLGETIKSLLAWLISSILSFFNNLVANIKAFIDAVIVAINNGFSNIFNNFKSLFSVFFQSLQNFLDLLKQSQEDFYTFCKNRLTDISTVLNGLSQGMAKIAGFYDYPLYFIDKYGFIYNQDMVTNILNRSDFIGSLTSFKTQVSTLSNNFSNVSEPDHLSFTLDFTNAYYNFGVCEFSFDWILPFRNPIRLFVVGVTVLSMLTNFIEDFPAMFSGGGGHSKNTGK